MKGCLFRMLLINIRDREIYKGEIGIFFKLIRMFI